MVNSICYITGRYGALETGLGEYLATLADEVFGVSLSRELMAEAPLDQVAAVARALDRAEAQGAPVIANSYGAYLTLQAMIGRGTLRTKVLLLSPVLGRIATSTRISIPPLAKRLEQALESGECEAEWLEMHIGEEDEGFDAERFSAVSRRLKSNRTVTYPGEGHSMTKKRVAKLTTAFIYRSETP